MSYTPYVFIYINIIRDGVVGNILACHADARGSIPRRGVYIIFFSPQI